MRLDPTCLCCRGIYKADSDLGTNSEVRSSLSLDSRCTFISRLPCRMHPPRFTPRLLPPKPRDLVRDTPPRSGDTSQCRVSARARGFLRGCCDPNHGRFKLLTCSTCSIAPYLEILDCRQALKFCVRYFLFIFFHYSNLKRRKEEFPSD